MLKLATCLQNPPKDTVVSVCSSDKAVGPWCLACCVLEDIAIASTDRTKCSTSNILLLQYARH